MTTDLARAAALAALLVLGHAVPASAQQKNVNERLQKLFDPKVIGAEATLQGEYRGKAGTKTFAAQVVARGDRRFHALVFPGGLPGDGWDGSTTPYNIASDCYKLFSPGMLTHPLRKRQGCYPRA